ncbi:hypothetical protein FRC10_005276 [Ceratobasidium sp. 414]|nr:hypothetical protein FRC10_005276 [Ceratobasidium sp. 414]
MPPSIPTVPLKDERAITAIAFSTGSALSKKDATASVIQALEGGFDRVDTAQAYHNEVEEALRQAFGKSSGYYGDEKVDPEGQTLGKLGREDIRVTTKYGLGLPSVGLYLIHNPQVAPDILKTWPGLESTHAHGKTEYVRNIFCALQQL